MAAPTLNIRDLRHSYPGVGGGALPVLHVDALTLQAGERLLVRGESGSGKSTLLHLVAGILAVQEGSLQLSGTELRGLSEPKRDRLRAQAIGYLFQTFNLLPGLSALENVALALTFQGKGSAAARREARASLDRVGLADRRHHRPHQLSVGQQQRVAIARALVGAPQLILADEPTSSLDPARADACLDLLEAFADETGAALLLVTHDPRLNARFPNAFTLQVPEGAAQ